MGIFEDDSEPSFEHWLVERLEGLAPGIRSETERWTRVLRDGGPRSLPRREGTVWLYLNRVRPALMEWSTRYDHLREVTRDDVLAYIKKLHGRQRHDQLVALRSLFTWAKRNGLIFRNPTGRIKVGQYEYAVLQPLIPEQVDRSVAAATTPATRLILPLAAVHAARVAQIATLMLDDVDLGNRRLTIAGRVRPLDDLTHKLLLDWLEHRRRRWPNTANLHLLINNQTANTTGRASNHWISTAMRGQDATLERLRVVRQLEEALAYGPDPLHLAEVFGLDEKTAMRYADSAQALRSTASVLANFRRRRGQRVGGTNSGWSSRRSQLPSDWRLTTCARAPAPSFGGVEVRAMSPLISVGSGCSGSKRGPLASTFSHSARIASRPTVSSPGG
jgi:hypothetical protein